MTNLTLPIQIDHNSAPDATLHVTARGLPVLIYNVNGAGSCPIHGAVFKDDGWELHSWRADGKYSSGAAHPFDLRDRAPVKRGVWVAWWEVKNGGYYATIYSTKEEADAATLDSVPRNLLALHYLKEGDGLDTPADPPLVVELPDD